MCGSLDFQIKIKGLSLQLIASHPFCSDSRGQEHPAANELGWVPTSLGNIISKLSINLYVLNISPIRNKRPRSTVYPTSAGSPVYFGHD